MTSSTKRHNLLTEGADLFNGILRGIEKEGLRVDNLGVLAKTPHPKVLGRALTNPRITTDYSEALLELITGTHNSSAGVLSELEDTHRFVAWELPDELIWNQSMPAQLPADADIPIAWYGTSNTGMLKHVYRRGLAERYGKTMQCIAGVHYNFSLPDGIWDLLEVPGSSVMQQRTTGYMALIRNFVRYAWLLMYLFGASPAVSKSFMHGADHPLSTFDDDTLYLPYATSLRMSDLGYQNKAQSKLQLCYNDLATFLQRTRDAVTTPWPAYEAIGTHRNGEWIQLNTNILQIENEYYASIRPKRTTGRGERPTTALAARGVQYIEVRCLDIDPVSVTGISLQTSHFIDAFLLFCATEESPFFPKGGYCQDSHDNFALTAKTGRKPGLMLKKPDGEIGLTQWGMELLDRIEPYADILDTAYASHAHGDSVKAQRIKVQDSEQTPSAHLLQQLREQRLNFHDYSLNQSRQHRDYLLATPLPTATQNTLKEIVAQSFAEQTRLEQSDTEDFSAYVARYEAALTQS